MEAGESKSSEESQQREKQNHKQKLFEYVGLNPLKEAPRVFES
jgi:hypothetical protein